ncbi:hypothetical protein A2810_02095 [candidate division Kazan bacterium RIFCSPHIGHO2_01_FULL_49_10]|uniref:Uncharacterized protein n=1 Tax=candidate division Kazan bacterium RIFCSPLOWO2_01_FULL_48_13 TaxID=1798539 RepID=A0A1F4PMR0_UNCK3|nr:MAG: hypothetical protein A2810_02095 [candidate division Kazan bacterium RIFCSPHIGHO2_01_FULL_49_10]OGB84971.1 MAG: hypothetical protein A2994_01280 [candidate division Kazan bacterium RIFCSPLOWO2_01_FULL_48_13]
MSVKRIFFGLFWIVWAGFWTQIAHETLGWSVWISLIALLVMPFWYNRVTNWWMTVSGPLSFVLFSLAGAGGMWLWSTTSPLMQYSSDPVGWLVVGLFWGYIGIAIAKVYITLEARYHPGNFNSDFLDRLKKSDKSEPLIGWILMLVIQTLVMAATLVMIYWFLISISGGK